MTSTAARPDGGEVAVPSPLLHVDGLTVDFATANGRVRVVEDVELQVDCGETLGLVGESGCGKTVTSLSILRLLPSNGLIAGGRIVFDGRDLADAGAAEMRRIRGDDVAMVFQEPMTSLNPAFTVGDQIAETIRAHRDVSRKQARDRAVEVLDRVGIPSAASRVKAYPHEFSGGMRQRAMIAMALALEPRLLIADEPTTALDVTIQAQILELVRDLQSELDMAVIFVTHDLGVVAEVCDRVAVMYAGEIVERSPVDGIFAEPRHPYTDRLLESMPQRCRPGEALYAIPGVVPSMDSLPNGCRFSPRCDHARDQCRTDPIPLEIDSERAVRCIRWRDLDLGVGDSARVADPGRSPLVDAAPRDPEPLGTVDSGAAATGNPVLLSTRGLTKHFPIRSGVLRRVTGSVAAVEDLDLDLRTGETVGLVGESGSGKSTTGRLILRLIDTSGGSICFDGDDVTARSGRDLAALRRRSGMVFQDPFSSLDPRATVADSIAEPLRAHRSDLSTQQRAARVAELLELVGLSGSHGNRYPHEFSGGQRQRIALARAIALDPALLVLDEPLSSLDVSTQSAVINLLVDLQRKLGLTYLFISHDLSVVRHLSERIAVMYLGRVVEFGPAEEIYERPRHPYTLALLSAVPVPDPVVQRERRRIVLPGDIPSPLSPPPGCAFHTRCPYAMEVCTQEVPPLVHAPGGTEVRCHLHTTGPTLDGAPVALLDRT